MIMPIIFLLFFQAIHEDYFLKSKTRPKGCRSQLMMQPMTKGLQKYNRSNFWYGLTTKRPKVSKCNENCTFYHISPKSFIEER